MTRSNLPRTFIRRIGGCALATACALPLANCAATLSEATFLRMGPMNVEPRADNVITTEEMSHSSKQYGLVSTSTKLMAIRYNIAYLGWTPRGLYVGFRTSIPPWPQHLTADDWVAVTVLPPGAKAPKRVQKPFGRKLKGAVDWGAACAETEFFLPLRDLGVASIKVGEPWGLQLELHYSSQEETAFWHLPAADGELATFVPDPESPVVGLCHFSPDEDWHKTGTYYIRHDVYNPTEKEIRLRSKTVLHHGISSSKLDDKAESAIGIAHSRLGELEGLAVPPGKMVSANYYNPPIWPGSVNSLENDITANGKTVYRRRLRWDLAKGLKWVDPVGLPTLTTGYWPSYEGLLRVKVEPNQVKDLVRAGVRVVGDDGKTYWEKEFRGQPNLPAVSLAETKLPDLPAQDYVVKLAGVDAKGGKYSDERTFAVRRLPWQGNKLGLDDVVIPPFRPIAAKEDRIDFTLTGYGMKGVFWDSIWAKGENILAAPVTLTLDGEEFSVTSVKTPVSKPTRVIREIEAVCRGVRLLVTQDYDYDGLCYVTMRFRPEAPTALSSLKFSIPLKDSHAFCYEVGWEKAPRDKVGCPMSFPPGEGEIWTSATDIFPYIVKDQGMAIQPYFWFGGPEKGIAWFTESSLGISVEPMKPVQRIVRQNGAATYEMNYVSRPTKWSTHEKVFKFGFQPTPVKPVCEKFLGTAYDMYEMRCPTNSLRYMMGGEFTIELFRDGYNSYPPGALDFMHWTSRQKYDVKLYKQKMEEYLQSQAEWFKTARVSQNDYRKQILPRFRYMENIALCQYYDPVIDCFFWPEWEMYKAEWGRQAWPDDFAKTEYGGVIAPSRIDMLLWNEFNSLKNGYRGIYFDCFATGYVMNDVSHPEGTRRYPQTGAVKGALCDIMGWRELTKRTAVMCYKNGGMLWGYPLVDFHTTLCYAVPVTSWCLTTLATECGSAGGDYQDRFKEGYTLAKVVARQSGSAPRFIVSTRVGDKARKAKEALSLLGYMCAYGCFHVTDQGTVYNEEFLKGWNKVFDFGWAKDDVERFFYYDEGARPVTHTGKDTRLTVQKRGGRAMLMFGNIGEAEDVAFDASGLGLGKKLVFTDAMSEERLARPAFHISKHGYKLILVDSAP